MLVFAGLGNPGPAYALNRHNAGFQALDAIHASHSFGPWKARFEGLVAEGRLGGARVLLLKPQTFMNESGRSVGQALRFYKLPAEALTVFHDDLDLAPLRVKVKRGGGNAGQRGLRSIDSHIGTDYRRVRIGIGHPGESSGAAKGDKVLGWVLGNWPKAQLDDLADLLGDIAAVAPLLATGEASDDARFLNDLAKRANPG